MYKYIQSSIVVRESEREELKRELTFQWDDLLLFFSTPNSTLLSSPIFP